MDTEHHDPVKTEKRSEDSFSRAAQILRQEKEQIKNLWEKKVRETVSEAASMDSPVLLDHLPNFLDELADILDRADTSPGRLPEQAMAQVHGEQRAEDTEYFLPELLKEYSLLREILNERLHSQQLFDYRVRNTIDQALDSIIAQSVSEFSKVHQEQTRNALDRAEASNRDLEHFAAIAAHDLKSPLATIISYLNLLDDKCKNRLGQEGEEYVEVIYGTAERMSHLVDRLLEYSRITQTDHTFEAVDLNEVIAATKENLADAIERTDASIQYDSLPTIRGEKHLLIQVFQNLIANSIKFTRNKSPNITIAAQEQNNCWCLSVKDEGIGFEIKQNENIFTLYNKLERESNEDGAGIGLASCRKVVELHGGQIWAESAPGRGATFYFTLPKCES